VYSRRGLHVPRRRPLSLGARGTRRREGADFLVPSSLFPVLSATRVIFASDQAIAQGGES
jgi:hypothetical protein